MAATKTKPEKPLNFTEATRTIHEMEGIKGYYRGMVPGVIKASFSAGLYFGTLAVSKKAIQSVSDNERFVNSSSSVVARLVQCILTNPFYVVKTRFEVIGFNEYNSVWDACKKVVEKEGYRGFFIGLRVAFLRDLPFSGLYYPMYEESKVLVSAALGHKSLTEDSQNDTVSLVTISAISAMIANVMSCLITHPIDIIRTRILFQFYNKDPT